MISLDLFSGIGGFAHGLEPLGVKPIAFCELEPYCRKILARHFPGVPLHDNVETLTYTNGVLYGDGRELFRGSIELVTGGFPCQDISKAGKMDGLEGERSGLWFEYSRILGDVRPRIALIENPAVLLTGNNGAWFARILCDLAALGYDAEWHCVPASAVGAPHIRDRVWIVATAAVADTDGVAVRIEPGRVAGSHGSDPVQSRNDGEHVADTDGAGREQRRRSESIRPQLVTIERGRRWEAESPLCRVDDGLSDGLDSRRARIKGLGNALIPEIVTQIARQVL